VARLPRQPAAAAVAAAAQGGPGPRQAHAGRHHLGKDQLDLDGIATTPDELNTILSIDTPRWKQEMKHCEQHLEQFTGLPEDVWHAHRSVAAALHDAD
jgi:GTP-dependent phosphoenolpyruvate carboxykinase